jgi:membrane protein implicated in regulation of membrane protease activity
LVTWSPFVLGSVGLVALGGLLYADPAVSEDISVVLGTASALAIVLFTALAVASALLPKRSIQDRLAGTWLVPR